MTEYPQWKGLKSNGLCNFSKFCFIILKFYLFSIFLYRVLFAWVYVHGVHVRTHGKPKRALAFLEFGLKRVVSHPVG